MFLREGSSPSKDIQLAQLVEQRSSKSKVTSSILVLNIGCGRVVIAVDCKSMLRLIGSNPINHISNIMVV